MPVFPILYLLLLFDPVKSGISEIYKEKFFADKIWGCFSNNMVCPNLVQYFPVSGCAYEEMGWICRPGTYLALNGSCIKYERNCWNPTWIDGYCVGCELTDRPAEGPTVLGCMRSERSCFYDRAPSNCIRGRYICAPGYHRTYPENKCVHDININFMYKQPGCELLCKRFFFLRKATMEIFVR